MTYEAVQVEQLTYYAKNGCFSFPQLQGSDVF